MHSVHTHSLSAAKDEQVCLHFPHFGRFCVVFASDTCCQDRADTVTGREELEKSEECVFVVDLCELFCMQVHN